MWLPQSHGELLLLHGHLRSWLASSQPPFLLFQFLLKCLMGSYPLLRLCSPRAAYIITAKSLILALAYLLQPCRTLGIAPTCAFVHATTPCAACSVALFCCACHALRFTPGPPPTSPCPSSSPRRSWSASPALFRDVGNGPTPPGFDDTSNNHRDDDAYVCALAECDTCDKISCPRGADEPASWTLTVEQFDEGMEEFFDRTFRACGACNRSCKKSFMGHKVFFFFFF